MDRCSKQSCPCGHWGGGGVTMLMMDARIAALAGGLRQPLHLWVRCWEPMKQRQMCCPVRVRGGPDSWGTIDRWTICMLEGVCVGGQAGVGGGAVRGKAGGTADRHSGSCWPYCMLLQVCFGTTHF